MKALLIALWLSLLTAGANAQLFKEWFRQNSTQRAYLKEQIAQLKLYLELTKEGYKIAREGLDAIQQIKNGEFKLHKNRFDSLRIVKSGITSLSRLQHITDLHGSINEICEQLPSDIAGCRMLDPLIKKQMLTSLMTLYDDSQVLVGIFFMVIRDDQVSMTDDERIRRIEDLRKDFEDNYLFAQNLRRQLGLVCGSAENELKEIDHRRTLNGIQ
ncbi:hypothetical protein LZD49_33285 [Dyadobacter sp. CY261]|uniref:hypothetical protein n=1 Tax=Dyadobacter sp. CY261 TaxID=2907203 RepID=UPI001F3FDD18|nr:hypothetical protein [Dyadobacter sp. CY261]MCF0075400.1 hypothetical protein [Dyadobacter sp. CY261]